MSLLQLLLSICCGSTTEPDQVQEEKPYPQQIHQQQPTAQPHPSTHRPPHQQPEAPPSELQETRPHHPSPQQEHPPRPAVERPSHVLPPPSEHSRPHGHLHTDQNQVNQHDEHYVSLRAQANAEGDQMAQAFQRSQEAYARGDGALAKQLSNEGKEHQNKMKSLHQQASDWIFLANNKECKPGEVNLHGLYVKEAISYTDAAIQNARQRGESQISLIVGKGLHSQGGVAKIKPAIEELMQKEQLVAELDPHNEGVLIIHIDGNRGDADTTNTVGVDEITRNLERNKGCIIM